MFLSPKMANFKVPSKRKAVLHYSIYIAFYVVLYNFFYRNSLVPLYEVYFHIHKDGAHKKQGLR